MQAWLTRWGPLAGALSAVAFVASFITGSSTPDSDQTGAQVISWYTAHHTSQILSNLFAALAMALLVAFAVTLAGRVRRGERWVAVGLVAGAVCLAVGLTATLGFNLVLALDTSHLTTASAQTPNLLQNEFILPLLVGVVLFGILGGLAMVAGRMLPAAMGWVLFAVGVAALVPPIAWFCLLGTMLWVLIASIWLTVQKPPAVAHEAVAASEQVPSFTSPQTAPHSPRARGPGAGPARAAAALKRQGSRQGHVISAVLVIFRSTKSRATSESLRLWLRA